MEGHVVNPEFDEQLKIIGSLKAENACLRDGLATLRVAVNDQQPDPGAVMFIDRTLAKADRLREGKDEK